MPVPGIRFGYRPIPQAGYGVFGFGAVPVYFAVRCAIWSSVHAGSSYTPLECPTIMVAVGKGAPLEIVNS